MRFLTLIVLFAASFVIAACSEKAPKKAEDQVPTLWPDLWDSIGMHGADHPKVPFTSCFSKGSVSVVLSDDVCGSYKKFMKSKGNCICPRLTQLWQKVSALDQQHENTFHHPLRQQTIEHIVTSQEDGCPELALDSDYLNKVMWYLVDLCQSEKGSTA
jgi:hypothetical protein